MMAEGPTTGGGNTAAGLCPGLGFVVQRFPPGRSAVDSVAAAVELGTSSGLARD